MVLFVPVCNSLLHPFSGVGNRVLVDIETIEPESETDDNDNLETDSEDSRDTGHCGVEYGALLDSYFCSQK